MSGTRSNIVQHLRTTKANTPPVANSLLDGEIAVEQADPMKLWVGVPTTLAANGMKLLYDKSSIGGGMTAVVHDATLTGNGVTGSVLSVVQASQAQRGGAEIATTAEIALVGTPVDTRIISPAGLRTQLVLPVADLLTTAKQVVPAINELINDLAAVLGVLVFAGAYDAAASTGHYNGHGGIAAGTGPLPVAAAGNDNAYLICYTNGPGSVGNEPAEALHMEDWLVSDGAVWVPIHLHQTQILAANVGITPIPGLGATNVQLALEEIWAVASTALQDIFFTTPTFSGDALTAGTALEVNILDAGSY